MKSTTCDETTERIRIFGGPKTPWDGTATAIFSAFIIMFGLAGYITTTDVFGKELIVGAIFGAVAAIIACIAMGLILSYTRIDRYLIVVGFTLSGGLITYIIFNDIRGDSNGWSFLAGWIGAIFSLAISATITFLVHNRQEESALQGRR